MDYGENPWKIKHVNDCATIPLSPAVEGSRVDTPGADVSDVKGFREILASHWSCCIVATSKGVAPGLVLRERRSKKRACLIDMSRVRSPHFERFVAMTKTVTE